jgi:hypothetical protein
MLLFRDPRPVEGKPRPVNEENSVLKTKNCLLRSSDPRPVEGIATAVGTKQVAGIVNFIYRT